MERSTENLKKRIFQINSIKCCLTHGPWSSSIVGLLQDNGIVFFLNVITYVINCLK